MLNAAFLGDLNDEDRRILGFGDKRNYRAGYTRPAMYPGLERLYRLGLLGALHATDLGLRLRHRVKRLIKG